MILIYKTNIDSVSKIDLIKPDMDKNLPNSKWTIDIEDCDNVLRIETNEPNGDRVKHLLQKHNFQCTEL